MQYMVLMKTKSNKILISQLLFINVHAHANIKYGTLANREFDRLKIIMSNTIIVFSLVHSLKH